jgi:poly(3-hydroxybutyrate) depolymerase
MAKVFRVVLNHRYDGVVHPVDAPYLAAVLRDVLRRYGGDSRRVYVVGFSSGAAMAADFAQSAPNAMAAVGIVGNVGLDRPRTLGHPVSAFLAIGVDDAFGKQTPASWSALPRVARQVWYGQDSLPTLEQDAATWARLDGCGSRGVTTTAWGQQLDWTGCQRRAHVRALSVDHLGHEWAGSTPSQWNRLHPAQPPLYLTDLLWRFFQSAGAD